MLQNSRLFNYGYAEECASLSQHFADVRFDSAPAFWDTNHVPWGTSNLGKQHTYVDASKPGEIGHGLSSASIVYILVRSLNLLETFNFYPHKLYSILVSEFSDCWWEYTPATAQQICQQHPELVGSLVREVRIAGSGFAQYLGLSYILQYAALMERVNKPLNLVLVNPTAHLHPDAQQHVCDVVSSQVTNIFKQTQNYHDTMILIDAFAKLEKQYETT